MVTRLFTSRSKVREGDVSNKGQKGNRFEDTVLLSLEIEEGARSQRRQAGSRQWERERSRFSLVASKSNAGL